MKIRTLLLLCLVLTLLLAILYVCWGLFLGPRLISDDLPTLVPDSPLAYIRCSDLQKHLSQFQVSEVYQQFLASPFFKQIQATDGWRAFLSSFEESWNSLFIDPMRLIGDELVIGFYETTPEDLLTPVILVSRVDGAAKVTERILYAFDRLSGGQIGMRFVEDVEHVPVYRVKNRDMLLPVYYAVIEDVAMVSTSFSLLSKAIRFGRIEEHNVKSEEDRLANVLTETIRSENSLLTSYLEISAILREFTVSPFWRSLELVSPYETERWASSPPISIALDREQHVITWRTLVDTPFLEDASSLRDDDLDAKPFDGTGLVDCKSERLLEEFPAFVQLDNRVFAEFLRVWQKLSRRLQAELLPVLPGISQYDTIFGERLECRLSQQLLGTLYAVPDIFCVAEPQTPSLTVMATLHSSIEAILAQELSPMVRSTMLKHNLETHGEKTAIGQVQLMFQPLLTYAVWPVEEQRSLAFVTTDAKIVRTQLAALATDPAALPYLCDSVPNDFDDDNKERMAAQLFVQPIRLGEFLTTLSDTQTFRMLVPQDTYPAFYEKLPDMLLLLRSLPQIIVKFGLQKQGLFAEIHLGEEFSE